MPFITYSIIFLIIFVCWVVYWTKYDIKNLAYTGIEWVSNILFSIITTGLCIIPVVCLGMASSNLYTHLNSDVTKPVSSKTYQIEAYSDNEGPFIGKISGKDVTYEFVTKLHNKVNTWNSDEVSGPITITEIAADQKPIMVVSEREFVGWIKWFAFFSPADKYEIFITPEINNYRVYN